MKKYDIWALRVKLEVARQIAADNPVQLLVLDAMEKIIDCHEKEQNQTP